MGTTTFCVVGAVALLGSCLPAIGQSTGPTDWSAWERYRGQVTHPATTIKPADLQRARENVRRHEWASRYVANLRRSAEDIAGKITPEYLERMIEVTTPGTTGPCPACRAQGLPWHPNGQWSWSPSAPDQLTCSVCKTVFPNDRFPEEIVLQSRWDPRQRFSFIGGDTFVCFGYTTERPSLSGIVRGRKVSHVTGQLQSLALAYALTQEPRYARAAKAILLRLAEVFPTYLVRAGYGYGEIADMDPHVAAAHITALPEDELVYPPNKPDRSLYTGYWSASRIGSSGMDGWWVCAVTEAYDLTCTAEDGAAPVYSDEERRRIERNVLLESTVLAVGDAAINNKSVGNRAGAAMVGLCVGHPGLVHFGLEGFRHTVEGWFLPDGGTSESPAYAMMAMSGIRSFGLAFRDYSDPPGHAAPDGRLDHFNACRDTRYGDCWQALIRTLQGDLRYPPSADSYRTTGLAASDAEMIALLYPTDEHLALLRELAGAELSGGSPREAVLYREPDLATRATPRFSLPDIVFPFLAQGYLRLGDDGRQGLVMLNASDWGGHHHFDSLNLYYWQDGRELLTDLGYLWDHPDSYQTRRSVAHNLVLMGGEQAANGRGGSFELFSVTPRIKVMQASSRAYPKASEYRRTCVQVDHGTAGAYLVDLFRAGGETSREYVFHGPGTVRQVEGLALAPATAAARAMPFAVRFHLAAVGEVLVDDVEVREVLSDGSEGPDLAPNPSAAGSGQGAVPGWGCYRGDGGAEWGFGSPGRADEHCARLRATGADAGGRVNVALLVGKSDGYVGPEALPGRGGTTYRLRFSLRGDADPVNVGYVAWPSDPKSPGDRAHGAVTLKGVARLSASADWQQCEGTFTLPQPHAQLEGAQEADGARPWRITWEVDKDYRFAAWSPGGAGERVVIGDGWGQRDHRNTDRGAKLPYVIRRAEKAPGSTAFVSVFAGGPTGRELVRGVTLLPVADGAPPGTVAVAVDTAEGTDVIVSATAPGKVAVKAPSGELTTAGLVAVVSSGGACLVGGTMLRAPGVEVTSPVASYSGTVAGTGSGQGESWFVVTGDLPETMNGAVAFVTGADHIRRAYPIRGVRKVGADTRLYTKLDESGFEARAAESWEVPTTAARPRP